MTTASEVHLFDWIAENRWWIAWIAGAAAGMLIFWYRTIINKFYTKEVVEDRIDSKIAKCKMSVDIRDAQIIDLLHELKKDMLEESRRNTSAHEHIIDMIVNKQK